MLCICISWVCQLEELPKHLFFTYHQKKPYCDMELDSDISSSKDIIKKKENELIVDWAVIKVGSEFIWLWVAIEPKNREILALNVSKELNMFVAERFFLSGLVNICGNNPTV